ILADVSKVDTRIQLFGQNHEFPILLAPTAAHKLMHPDGELGTVHGASLIGATFVLSSFSSTSLEDVAAAAKAPLWFQLYARTDRGFTRELVERAQSAGYSAICLTVDTPIPGTRTRERRARVELPELPNLRGLNPKGGLYGGIQNVYSAILDPS